MSPNATFKKRLLAREQLVGCFIKTPHPTVIEVLGATDLDFLVLDGEHSPFDKVSINLCMLAAKAVGVPLLIRVPDDSPAFILNVLDCGAAGVVVPHVVSVEQAETLARSMRYVPGGRGIAGTTRAGGYGAVPLPEHRAAADSEVSLICQIEDREGVKNAEAIAAVDGVDALFVGRADLTVSYGLSDFNDAGIAEKCADVLEVKGATTGLFVAPTEDMAPWRDKGASFFLSGSDHSFLFAGAKELASRKQDTSS
ncbi:aldolase/citrate lyase family protein [Aliiroseovarius sp. KMU-50]|uniref:Aldolase/citrate lyase family protein n=1 Tax=Aliiroseovarius salicola TaxID=3009082 RepID=A0ABT4W4N9_9RHOB|nr:aldolase/citrate lyase family protein [Aliiroseovarius sp. KMU-50]MDA5095471.1 aldolase/citrate lyase family protein [Aliiroseovarius sp. KMU-50]